MAKYQVVESAKWIRSVGGDVEMSADFDKKWDFAQGVLTELTDELYTAQEEVDVKAAYQAYLVVRNSMDLLESEAVRELLDTAANVIGDRREFQIRLKQAEQNA